MKGNPYHLSVNHFADMTDAEFQRHKGLMPGDGDYGSFDFDEDNKADGYEYFERRDRIDRKTPRYGHVPWELDWRKYGKYCKTLKFTLSSDSSNPCCDWYSVLITG